MDPRRARWVVERLTPANLADAASAAQPPDFPSPAVKGEAWSRAVHATALPDRWVVVGYQRGAEVFRRWGASIPDLLATTPTPEPGADPQQPTVAAANEPPGDDPMKWVLDYPTAERIGMAVTVRQADLAQGHSLSGGLDRLVVLGVDWTLDPASASARIASLLAAHRVTDGLSFVPAGSATNNTESVRSELSTATSAAAADLDPAVPPAEGQDTAAHRLAAALGLEDDALASTPGAGLLEERTASLMHQVLWRATLGHFLDELMEPVVSDATVGLARDHVEHWLRPGGPFATLRIGKQPYGVLPVVAPGRFVPERAGGFEADLAALLTRIRWVWANAVGAVPRMGRTGDPDTDLLELMQLNPVSAVARFRKVLGPIAVANTKGMREHADAQAWSWMFWKSIAGWPAAPALAGYTADPKDHPLPVPWVQATPAGGEELAPNYLRSIAASARTPEGRAVIEDEQDADTLLHAMVAHAAVEELSRAGSLAVQAHLGSAADLVAAVKSIRTAEMYGVEVGTASGGVRPERLERRSVTVSTPRQVASLVLPALTGTQPWPSSWPSWSRISPDRAEVAHAERLPDSARRARRAAGEKRSTTPSGVCSTHFAPLRRLGDLPGDPSPRDHPPVPADRGPPGRLRLGRGASSRPAAGQPRLRARAVPDAGGAAAILRSGHLSHRDDEHEALRSSSPPTECSAPFR